MEESMAGHVGIMEFIKSEGRELQKEAWWDQVEARDRELESQSFSFLGTFKTYTSL
jgi:hypothetical protein